MIVFGVALVISAIALPAFFRAKPESSSTLIPDQVGGLPLVSEATGSAALREFTQLHGKSLSILSGSKASYGLGDQVTLWVAGTASITDSRQMLESMRDKIAEGNSPFQPAGTSQDGNRMVYLLDGMGQKHYYFQSGKYLVWLSSNPQMAIRALKQVLNYYP
jgi:hypothetical protein